MDEQTNGHTDEIPASPLELIYLTRAYNQGEISTEDWLERSRAWAEAIIRQLSPTERPTVVTPD